MRSTVMQALTAAIFCTAFVVSITAVIQEGWGRVQRFDVQAKEGDQWHTVLEGKTIGPHFERQFIPVRSQFVRLNIHEASDVPTIWEFHVFDRSEVPK